MSYVALYRVWRPKRWQDVVNQRAAVRILKNALSEGKVAHAYLFSGPRGTGKTTVARLLAKAVNCANLQGTEPCNSCQSCISITEGNSVDVIEIDAASNRGIDEIRSLRESVRYLPVMGKYKVYIIDEVHMLTQEAFNALLKTLEEPPEHVIFILATTAPHKIPVTITSRCQRLEFKRLSIFDIENRLEKILASQEATWDKGALRIIARAAQGSLRDALSILDLCITYGEGNVSEENVRDVLGETSQETMMRLFRALSQRDLKGVLDVTREISDRGKDMSELCEEISVFARDLLLLRLGGKQKDLGRTDEETEEMAVLSRSFSPIFLISLLEAMSRSLSSMRNSDNPRLILDTALLGLFLEDSSSKGTIASGKKSAASFETRKVENMKMSRAGIEREIEKEDSCKNIGSEKPAGESDKADLNEKILEEVKSAWPKLLEELLKKRKVQARAYLLPASPVRVENGNTLILAYRKGYVTHMEQILAPANKEVVERYIARIVGRNLRLEVESSDLGSDGYGDSESEDEENLHPLVKAAITILDGKLVK